MTFGAPVTLTPFEATLLSAIAAGAGGSSENMGESDEGKEQVHGFEGDGSHLVEL